MAPRPLLCLTAFLLAACVPEGDFPSLAQRPGERDRSTEEPVRPDVEAPDDAELRREVAALRRLAAQGDAEFDAAYGPAAAAVAAAGAAESDSWVDAQQALSRLEAAREATTRALAELDRLAMDRVAAPTSAADFAEIDAAIATVERLAAGQQQRMDSLRARLSRR